MSTQYDSYEQVPWFRKWWFAAIGTIVFMPAIVVMAFTGNFYFPEKGKAKKFATWYKFFMLGFFLLAILGYIQENKSLQKNSEAKFSEKEMSALFQEAWHKPLEVNSPQQSQ